jgi:ribosomal silencing factor RsfS
MALKDKVKEIEKTEESKNMEFPSMDEAILMPVDQLIFMVYGDKGSGKTAIAYSLMEKKDKVMVFSFDGRSADPMELKTIKSLELDHKIINATMFYNKTTDIEWLNTAQFTYDWVIKLLKDTEPEDAFKPDWIIIDGFDRVVEICEMIMRRTYKLTPFSGVQTQFWRKRKQLIDALHGELKKHAKKGVFYTTYPKDKNSKMKNGEIIDSKQIPNWIGEVMEEAHIVIYSHSAKDPKSAKWQFYADIQSSKKLFYPEGEYNVTGIRLLDLLDVKDTI